MRIHQLIVSATTIVALSVCSIAGAQTIATVNGSRLTQAQFNMLSKGQKLTAEQTKALKERMIQMEVVAQAAKRKNLQNAADVKAALDLSEAQILANAYIAEYAKTIKVTDAEVKAVYDEQMAMLSDKEYKVRHILVKTEAEANTIINQLKQGQRFADLAKTKSLDKESAVNGGSLDWVQPGIFGDALFGITKGQYTQKPVQTPAGFHVVYVDNIRPFKKPTLAQAKDQIIQMIKGQKVSEHLNQLRQEAKVQ